MQKTCHVSCLHNCKISFTNMLKNYDEVKFDKAKYMSKFHVVKRSRYSEPPI